jgi:hypothetical protein
MAHARVESDKVDARILAHLLRADLRELLRARYAWTQQHTRAKNRIHGLLPSEATRPPVKRLFVAYAGLVPRVRPSVGAVHTGRITRQGSVYPRWILTEAAQRAVRLSLYFGELFRKQLAMITLAGKLLSLPVGF